jgi:hypothetical protein
MPNRPLVYFWIAHYNDKTSLPQFDPYDYHENAFKDIQKDKLIKFGLYPFTKELADGIYGIGTAVISIPILPKYEINIINNRRLIHYRDVFISHEDYHLCRRCGREFMYNKNMEKVEGTKYPSPICPHCGSHDLFICKSCGKEWDKFESAPFGMCSCKSHLRHERITSGQYSREKRWIDYFLGYQETIDNKNTKFLLRIKENGDSEIL